MSANHLLTPEEQENAVVRERSEMFLERVPSERLDEMQPHNLVLLEGRIGLLSGLSGRVFLVAT
jgi:hypothetical protein